jgi:FMN phosphatase YigB (HAD superfamily)
MFDRKVKKALITDFDNTLFDWVDFWYNSFSAMLSKVVDISNISEETLKLEIRDIHRRYGTSEYAFLLREIPSLREFCGDIEVTKQFQPAIDAYRLASGLIPTFGTHDFWPR